MRASEPDPGALTSIVLAAGRGRRFEPLDRDWPKALLPVLDRPLLRRQLDALVGLGVRETVLVVGHLRERIVLALEQRPVPLRLTWVTQPEPLGIADALACAAPHLTRPFLCLLGDVCFDPADLARVARGLEGADAALAVRQESDPRETARSFAVDVGPDGWVRSVEEKPRASTAAWRGVGLYAFRPEFLALAGTTPASTLRGERELTDAIQRHLERGARVRAVECLGRDFNLSSPTDLLEANLHALAESGRESWIADDAEVAPGASVTRSVVLAGARVASGARLERVLVFPGERVPSGDYASLVWAAGTVLPCPPRA